MAVCILLAVVLASVSLLQQLFYLKYPPESQAPLPAPSGECCVEDISLRVFAVMLLTAAVLVCRLSILCGSSVRRKKCWSIMLRCCRKPC